MTYSVDLIDGMGLLGHSAQQHMNIVIDLPINICSFDQLVGLSEYSLICVHVFHQPISSNAEFLIQVHSL